MTIEVISRKVNQLCLHRYLKIIWFANIRLRTAIFIRFDIFLLKSNEEVSVKYLNIKLYSDSIIIYYFPFLLLLHSYISMVFDFISIHVINSML